MLRPAQLYEDEIAQEFYKTWYDEKYKYYVEGAFCYMEPVDEDTSESHQYASVVLDNVIGYISYRVDRTADIAYDMNIINFADNLAAFGRDLAHAVDDIFCKFNFNKLEFGVIVGNPAEKMYDKFIKMTGGRVVGTLSQHVKLIDGKIYDLKMYELSRKNYLKHRESFFGIELL